MSEAADWLRRLNGTTNYTELREIFGQIAAHAQSIPDESHLATTIDEAIQRLIGERTRDEKELSADQSRYESFRQDNRGVVGWFKRHIPFTETRRQELEHQGELAERNAEILADNLVIARAQMIKERLLPPARRRLGQRVLDWQAEWERRRVQPVAAAQLLAQLQTELEPSRAFVKELRQDIEAFSTAGFREAADRERRDLDVAEAQRELDMLQQEIDAERALQKSGLHLLTSQVATELAASNAEFRRDGRKLEQLDAAGPRLDESRVGIAKLLVTVGKVGELAKQLQSWPEQLQQAREANQRIEFERASAAQVSAAKSEVVQERQLRVDERQRSASQAAQLLAGLQPAYDAYLAQRVASATMPQAVEFEPAAPIVQQHQAARQAVEQSQAQLREMTAALESARRDASQATAAVAAAAEKLALEQKKLGDLQKQEPQVRAELSGHSERGQREFASLANALATYMQIDRAAVQLPPYRPEELAARTFGYLGPLGLERSFANALLHPGQEVARQLQAAATLDRVSQWLAAQQQALEQERVQTQARREALWKQRCRELLGDSMAEEACAEGLGG